MKEEQPGTATATNTGKHMLRSTQREFNFGTDCFFCGEPAIVDKKRKTSEVVTARTVEMRATILAVCHDRGDDWANAVQARVLQVHDLHAADAVYHRVCSVNFRTMKNMPLAHGSEGNTSKKVKLGRPQEKQQSDAFLETTKFLEENDDEQITIYDLIQHMEECMVDSELGAYSYQYMQQKLKEHFGDRIIETEINGKPNVVTFRNKAKTILHEFYCHRDTDSEKEKMRIIETAAKLIREDIKAVKTSNSVYPGFENLGSDVCINFYTRVSEIVSYRFNYKKRKPDENCFNWASYNAGSSSQSFIGTFTSWFGCATASPVCITLPHRYITSAWFLPIY